MSPTIRILFLLLLGASAAVAESPCPNQFVIGSSYVPYCSNGKSGPAVFVIHGSNRNADEYLTYLEDLDTLVIAPHFQDSGPGMYWSSGWRMGNKSLDPEDVSSFEVLDLMVEAFDGTAVVGHSAGGQFVTRYAAATPMADLTFIAANAGTYMYLDETRPVGLGSSCADFNEYHLGLDSPNSYMSIGVAPDYPDRDVIYLLGSGDNSVDGNLDTSCAAKLQGRHRYDRGKKFFSHLAQHYGRPVHRRVIVYGVGHDAEGMLDAARPYLPD